MRQFFETHFNLVTRLQITGLLMLLVPVGLAGVFVLGLLLYTAPWLAVVFVYMAAAWWFML